MAKANVDFSAIDREKLPKHVAIIMDGNGRWAKKRMMPRSFGHRAGMERVKDIVRMSSDIGISALTLYAFSTENWKRPKEEVGVLMSLLIEYLRRELGELLKEGVRFRFVGMRDRLPAEVQSILDEAMESTRDNTGMDLCVLVNYGSRAEIVEAASLAAEEYAAGKISEVNAEEFEKHLMTAGLPDPDFVIRTSGEQRISNLLLYQIAYAELYFTDVAWPDFDEKEYLAALQQFAGRNRRFGDIK